VSKESHGPRTQFRDPGPDLVESQIFGFGFWDLFSKLRARRLGLPAGSSPPTIEIVEIALMGVHSGTGKPG
jgi:hypothetical protein